MKSLRLVVLLVGVLSLTITGCSLSRGSATPQYRTESVAKGTLQVSVAASGTTVFPNVAKLTFGSSGTVQEINVDVGEEVTKGRVLARLDTASLETQLLQARQVLLNSQKALQDYLDSLSEAELARLRAAVESGKAAVVAAEDALARAKEVTGQQLAQADVSVANARLAVAKAQEALEESRTISERDIAQAEATIANARIAMAKAQEALEQSKILSEKDMAQAEATLSNARLNLEKAKDSLDKTTQFPESDEIAGAKDAVESAKAAVRNTEVTLNNANNDVTVTSADWAARITDLSLQVDAAKQTYQARYQSRYRPVIFDAAKSPQELLGYPSGADILAPAVQTAWDTLVALRKDLEALQVQADYAKGTAQGALLVELSARIADKRSQISAGGETYQAEFQSRFSSLLFDVTKNPQENLGYPPGADISATEVQTAWDALAKLRNQSVALQLQAQDAQAAAQNGVLKAQEALETARKAQAAAEGRLAELLRFSPLDVEVKQKAVDLARATLNEAQDTLAKLKAGLDPLDIQAKEKALGLALANLKEAEEDLAKLKAGPDPLDIQAKEKALGLATANLKEAEEDLAKLKAGPDQVAVQQKASALETAKASLLRAQVDLEKQLKGPDPILLESKKLAVETAQKSLQDAEQKLATASLVAPFNGIVSVVSVEEGLSVGANAVAIVVVDPSQVEVNASVDEVDVMRLQPGMSATITLDAVQGVSLSGTVETISPTAQVQQGVVSYDLTLKILGLASGRPQPQAGAQLGERLRGFQSNSQGTPSSPAGQRPGGVGGTGGLPLGLRAGMTATASILITQKQDVLLVPLRAVRTSGGRRVVEVLKDGQPVQQEVQLGLTNDQFAEVASGLSEGEQVIVSTQQSGQSQQQAPGPGGAIPRGFFR